MNEARIAERMLDLGELDRTCCIGLTLDETQKLFSVLEWVAFTRWMRGQTMGICPQGHGSVAYQGDVIRFIKGLAPLD